jgi:hypothetical protein
MEETEQGREGGREGRKEDLLTPERMYLSKGSPLPAQSVVGSSREQRRTPESATHEVKAREIRRAYPQPAS